MGQIQSKHIVAGGVISAMVIGAAGLIYYYNEDSHKPHALPQNLTTEAIINILQDLRVEFTPTLIHWFQVYQQLQQQSQGNLQPPEKALSYIKDKVQSQCSEIESEICKKHKISKEELDGILAMDSKDPQDSFILRKVKELNEIILAAIEATTSGQRPNLKLQIPEELSKEVYLLLYRRLLMGIRHNHYMKIREKVRANGGEFEKNMIKDLGQAQSNQEIRGKVFEYYGVPKVKDEDYHRTLKKAFYLYYEDKEFQRQVEVLQKHNHEILQNIIQGDVLPDMERDPFSIEDAEIDNELQEASKQRALKFQKLLERFSQQGGAQEGGNPLFQLIQQEQERGKDEPVVEEVEGGGKEEDKDEDYEDVEDESQNDQELPRREDELKKKEGKADENDADDAQQNNLPKKEEPVAQEKKEEAKKEEEAKDQPKKEEEPKTTDSFVKVDEPKKADAFEGDAFDEPQEKKAEEPAKPAADAFDEPTHQKPYKSEEPQLQPQGDAFDEPEVKPAPQGDAFDEPEAKKADAFEGDAFDEPEPKKKNPVGDAFDD